MRIEKRFYDLAKAQWDEIEKEVRQEDESRTEAEREIEKLKTRKELQEIYRKGEEYASKWKRLPDEKQIQLFHRITEQALWMAESISCNMFSNLFLAANDACVDISSAGLCKIEFCFWLYQEVPVNKAT